MWKRTMLFVFVIVSMVFLTDYVSAQQKSFNDLAGKKWTSEVEVTQPRHMWIIRTVEIETSVDGKIKGFFSEYAKDEGPRRFPFANTAVEENPYGLARFKFKISGTTEIQCDVHEDGRLALQKFLNNRSYLPQFLAPVK